MELIKQYIPYTKKDYEWRKSNVEHIISYYRRFEIDRTKMQENYNIKNSILDEEDYRSICTLLGVEEQDAATFIHKFNITYNVIEAYLGEEKGRDFSVSVYNNAPNTVNEVLRKREEEFYGFLNKIVEKTIVKSMGIAKLDTKLEGGEIDDKNYAKAIEKLNKDLEEKYKYDLDKESLRKRTNNIITVKEQLIAKLVRVVTKRLKLSKIKNEVFEDVLLNAREFVLIDEEVGTGMPIIRPLNPLQVYFNKSNSTEYIQDGDSVGYREYVTMSNFLLSERKYLKDEDLQQIETEKGGVVYGLDDYIGNPDSPNGFSRIERSKIYSPLNPRIEIDGELMGIPNYGGTSYEDFGMSYQESDVPLFPLDRVFWVSQRRVVLYTYVDEYGDLVKEWVDEDFVIPPDANKVVHTEDSMKESGSAYVTTKMVWYRDNKYNCVTYEYVPEVWQGKCFNNRIFYDMRPIKHGYKNLLNPYKVKLPICGKVFNNRNAPALSVMDKMKAWYKMYLFFMSKLILGISKDMGVMTFINQAFIDSELGFTKSMQLAIKTGFIPYNPHSTNQGGLYDNTRKVVEQVDATNSNSVQYYMNLLEFVEAKILKAVGFSEQRLANSSTGKTATDNYNDTVHSLNISETLFAHHELFWESVIAQYMETLLDYLKDKKGHIRGFLSNEEVALLEVDDLGIDDEFLFELSNNPRVKNILQNSGQMLHALLQNEMIDLNTFIELLEYEDLSSLKKHLSLITEQNKAQAEAQQKQADDKEEKLLKLQIDREEDAQKARLDEIALKAKLEEQKALKVEELRGKFINLSFDTEKDYNKDGIKDYMQLAQLEQRIDNDTRKIELQEKKLNVDSSKGSNDVGNKDKREIINELF